MVNMYVVYVCTVSLSMPSTVFPGYSLPTSYDFLNLEAIEVKVSLAKAICALKLALRYSKLFSSAILRQTRDNIFKFKELFYFHQVFID